MIKKLELTSVGTYKFQDESKGKELATFGGNGRPGGNQQRAPNQQMAPPPGKRQANSPPMNQRDEKRRHKACDRYAQLEISPYSGEPTVECSICTGLHHARWVGSNPGTKWVCELCCKKNKNMATHGDLSNAYPYDGSLDDALKKANRENKDFNNGSLIRRGVQGSRLARSIG